MSPLLCGYKSTVGYHLVRQVVDVSAYAASRRVVANHRRKQHSQTERLKQMLTDLCEQEHSMMRFEPPIILTGLAALSVETQKNFFALQSLEN